jgi:dTDP-4-dehydrorhamnose 3,5-epimerase
MRELGCDVRFVPTPLEGVWLIEPERIEDDRGYFARAWCKTELADQGVDVSMVQGNIGYSHARGTVRGMHWQEAPFAEVKMVRCTRGSIYDVVVDVRPDSEAFMFWFGAELTSEDSKMMLVPEGFAHGYQTLDDRTEIFYLTSQFYESSSATGARYDDPGVGIEWPIDVTVISEQDRKWPSLTDRGLHPGRRQA